MTNMKDFFLDPSGQLSMMRVLSALVVVMTIVIWSVTVFNAGAMSDIPENIMYLNASALFGKAIQKGFEK